MMYYKVGGKENGVLGSGIKGGMWRIGQKQPYEEPGEDPHMKKVTKFKIQKQERTVCWDFYKAKS